MFLSPFLTYVVVLRVSQGRRKRLVVAGLEAREVVPGARAGARRGPRGARARPVARRDARRMFWSYSHRRVRRSRRCLLGWARRSGGSSPIAAGGRPSFLFTCSAPRRWRGNFRQGELFSTLSVLPEAAVRGFKYYTGEAKPIGQHE